MNIQQLLALITFLSPAYSFLNKGISWNNSDKPFHSIFFTITAASINNNGEASLPNEITKELINEVPWQCLIDAAEREEEELTTLNYKGTKQDFLNAFFYKEDSMQYALSDVGEEIAHAPTWQNIDVPLNTFKVPKGSNLASSSSGVWGKFIRYFHPRDGPEFIFGKEPGWYCTQMHMLGVPKILRSGESSVTNDDNLFVFIDLSPIPLCSGTNYILRFNMKENNQPDAKPSTDVTVNLSVFTPKTMYSSFIKKGVRKDVSTLVQRWKSRVTSAVSKGTIAAAASQFKIDNKKSPSTKFLPIDIASGPSPF